MEIRKVDNEKDLEKLLPLIAEYQRFYKKTPNLERNRVFFSSFLHEQEQGILFAGFSAKNRALEDTTSEDSSEEILGYAMLYILPSSLTAQNSCILNDLYTAASHRGKGIGNELVTHCARYAYSRGFRSLEWQTEVKNEVAQYLYKKFQANRTAWYLYSLELSDRF